MQAISISEFTLFIILLEVRGMYTHLQLSIPSNTRDPDEMPAPQDQRLRACRDESSASATVGIPLVEWILIHALMAYLLTR